MVPYGLSLGPKLRPHASHEYCAAKLRSQEATQLGGGVDPSVAFTSYCEIYLFSQMSAQKESNTRV